jgi:hypothetical protein
LDRKTGITYEPALSGGRLGNIFKKNCWFFYGGKSMKDLVDDFILTGYEKNVK